MDLKNDEQKAPVDLSYIWIPLKLLESYSI